MNKLCMRRCLAVCNTRDVDERQRTKVGGRKAPHPLRASSPLHPLSRNRGRRVVTTSPAHIRHPRPRM